MFLIENGICIGQNATAEVMFGYSESDAIGRPIIEWYAPVYREMIQENVQKHYELPYEAMALRERWFCISMRNYW